MRIISDSRYRKIIESFNDVADKEASAMATVLLSWGRNSEIDQVFVDAEKKKLGFAKLFE